MDTGRAAEVDTTSPPLPPFFPPAPVSGTGVGETTGLTLLVEIGRSAAGEVFGSFPLLPPLPVGDGTAGEVEETIELRTVEEETPERVAVGLTTEVDRVPLEAGGMTEDEVPLPFDAPLLETVNWRGSTY